MQQASGGYRGAGGSVLVAVGAACQQGNGCRPAVAIDNN